MLRNADSFRLLPDVTSSSLPSVKVPGSDGGWRRDRRTSTSITVG
jgi:hypothetical protein